MVRIGKLIAKNLAALLEESGLYPSQYAERAGIDQPVVSRALSGHMDNPTLKTLSALVGPSGRDITWLLTDHDAPGAPLAAEETAQADRDLLDLVALVRGRRDMIQRLLRMAKAGTSAAQDKSKASRTR